MKKYLSLILMSFIFIGCTQIKKADVEITAYKDGKKSETKIKSYVVLSTHKGFPVISDKDLMIHAKWDDDLLKVYSYEISTYRGRETEFITTNEGSYSITYPLSVSRKIGSTEIKIISKVINIGNGFKIGNWIF